MNWKALYNSIARQEKSPVDKITTMEWNAFINLLSVQSNNNTEGVNEALRLFKAGEKRLDDVLETLKLEYKDEMLSFIEKNINIELVVEKEKVEELLEKYIDEGFFETIDNELDIITVELKFKKDITLLNEIKRIWIDIPDDIEHGFYASINFKTSNELENIFVINNTENEFTFLRNDFKEDEIKMYSNKEYSLVFYFNGLTIYCYYSVI